MASIWPETREIRVTHGWKGNVAFTFDQLPHMGVHQGIHYAGGCQGAGVALATYLGYQSALKLLGKDKSPCGFDNLPFPGNLLYRGKPWFLPLVGNFYKALDYVERRAG